MRAAMYYGNHKLEIEDIPEPTPREGEVEELRSGRKMKLLVYPTD